MSSVDLSPFGTNRAGSSYPAKTLLIFGSDYGHSGFVTPMARFQFFNAFGESTSGSSPIIFIHMGGTFQTALQNGYSETTSIFGMPNSETGIGTNLATIAKGGLDAVYKQLQSATAGAAGFISSAGLSGKAQYEFLTRRVLNTFQQLIYNGPTFRRFQLPFTMKPTSLAEAEKMIDIIKSFQIASSPKGKADAKSEKLVGKAADNLENTSKDKADQVTDDSKVTLADSDIRQITGEAPGNLDGSASSGGLGNFSFGYPDMCQFEIILKKTTGNTTEGGDAGIAMGEIFQSGYCVIENVQVDYGGQNKMIFFNSATGGKYYPSEVTMTIGLRETTLPTADFMSTNHTSPERTIF